MNQLTSRTHRWKMRFRLETQLGEFGIAIASAKVLMLPSVKMIRLPPS
jgi:hypothetical protein